MLAPAGDEVQAMPLGRRFNWSTGEAQARVGRFSRPEHLRGERPDYMRSGRSAVGFAFSFRLGS